MVSKLLNPWAGMVSETKQREELFIYIINSNNFRSQEQMSSPNADYDENQQSIQFYKIKLMEKEREISQNGAKLKKIEFKNNRDIKELKMAEEKVKVQLKDEKAKLDKATKSLIETTEQNNVLQFRMNELKEEKDKQIESTRAQYNFLKNQVRSYERILPTHTFMSKLGATYEQLPTYEEVFINWKDKSQRLDEMEGKMKKLKAESQEKIEMGQKVSEALQKKKQELEKQLRDDITKLLDLQSQVATLIIERDDLRIRCSDLAGDLGTVSHNLELQTEYSKQIQLKIEELSRTYQAQIHNKEYEIQKVTEEEFRKYEEQIERITRTFEMKQNSHLQQLAYFEEQQHRLLERLQKDKEKFQQTYREIYGEVDKIKRELDIEKEERWKQKTDYDKLKTALTSKTNEHLQCIRKLGEDQVKIQQLSLDIKKLQDKILASQSDENFKQGEHKAIKSELELKIKQLTEEVNQLREQIILKDHQIRGLHVQIEELKAKGHSSSNFKSNSLGFSGLEPDQDSVRDRSNTEQNSEFEKVGSLQQVTVVTSAIRNRQQSIVSQQSHTQQRRTSANYYTQAQFEAKLAEGLKSVEKEIQSRYHIKIEQAKLLTEQQFKEDLHKEIVILTGEHKKQLNQSRRNEEDAQCKLKRLNDEFESFKLDYSESIAKWGKKYDLLKSDKQAIEQNSTAQVLESKKDKQSISVFKNQNRQLEKTLKQYQRIMENQNNQLETLKKYKQNNEAKESKQKSVSSESSSTNLKDIIEKYTNQITKIMQEKQQIIKKYDEAEQLATNLRKQIQNLNKNIQSLRIENQEKSKQNQMLLDLLDHERKDRTLRTVPSLASLRDQDGQQQENFKQFYNQAGQKEGQITLLERQLADIKSQMEDEKKKYQREIASQEQQMKGYIEEIINMKLKVANAEMKASEKTHLYNQLKKKLNIA